jgi:hypothetical protein
MKYPKLPINVKSYIHKFHGWGNKILSLFIDTNSSGSLYFYVGGYELN